MSSIGRGIIGVTTLIGVRLISSRHRARSLSRPRGERPPTANRPASISESAKHAPGRGLATPPKVVGGDGPIRLAGGAWLPAFWLNSKLRTENRLSGGSAEQDQRIRTQPVKLRLEPRPASVDFSHSGLGVQPSPA